MMKFKKYINFFISLVLLPILVLLRFIFSFSRRVNNIWIFSSWNGLTFSDNAKYLFIYTNENLHEIKSFWITKKIEIYNELKNLGLPVLYLYSLKGVMTCLKAGVQFTTHGVYDISPILTKGAINFSLFHASFPLKKMEYDSFETNFIKKIIMFIMQPFVFEKADFSVCSSSITRSIIKSALNLDKEKVLMLGYPRNDYINIKNHSDADKKKINKMCDFSKYSNFIYFVPTFRVDPDFNFFDFNFNKNELVKFLELTNSIIVFRFHPFDYKKMMKHKTLIHPRFIFESHGLDDPYPLLTKASLLVTDYSSIFADFLLLNKPIIFANFDHQGYLEKERTLYWDYDDVTPGPKVSNWQSLIREMKNVLVHGKDSFSKEREKMKKIIFDDLEYSSSERVSTHVRDVILNKFNCMVNK